MRSPVARALAALAVTTLIAGLPGIALAGDPSVAPPSSPAAASSPGATTKITRDQAISLAKQAFAIPEELGAPDVNFNQGNFGASWGLNWGPKPGEHGTRYSVNINANTGDIQNYWRNRDNTEQLPPLSLTRDEAQALADAALAQFAPDYQKQVKLHDNALTPRYFYPGQSTDFSFNYERLYQDIPVANQGITITIDARTKDLSNYNLNWNKDMKFTAATKVLSQADAEQAWKQNIAVEAAYVQIVSPGMEKPEWHLVYRTNGWSTPPIDATTGKPVEFNPGNNGPAPWSTYEILPATSQSYQPPKQALTQQEALTVALAAIGTTMPDPTNVNYNESAGHVTYGFNWNLTDVPSKGWQTNTNVGVDATRGVIINFGSWSYDATAMGKGQPPTALKESDIIPAAQARNTAMQWLLRSRPDLTTSVRLAPYNAKNNWCRMPGETDKADRQLCSDLNVQFQFFHNGIPVLNGNANVDVDLRSGQVRNAWFGSDPSADTTLPASDTKITAAAAADAYVKAAGLRLIWMPPPSPGAFMGRPYMQPKSPADLPPAQLYFTTSNPVTQVDSQTGHALDGEGRDLTRLSTRPTDISGHFAQKEIELLLARGVMEANDGLFKPGQAVTRGEAIQMLVLVMGRRPFYGKGGGYFGDIRSSAAPAATAAAPFVEAAVRSGIVLPKEEGADFHPEQPVTREQFALWTVRAMGYGAIASMPVSINIPFSDAAQVGAGYRNAVALMVGLGIIHGDTNGTFRPADQTTRGEAAIFLYAVMSSPRPMYMY